MNIASGSLKIGVFGVGAIGSVISFSLWKKHQIYHYNRSDRDLVKLKFQNETKELPIILKNPEEVPTLDLLFVCLKEYHYEEASRFLEKLVSSNTRIIVVRNGINLKDKVLDYAEESHIIECIVDCPTEELGDAFYHQLRKGTLTIDEKYQSLRFHDLLDPTHLEFKYTVNFKTESWKKLISSSSFGGILCLSGNSPRLFKDKFVVAFYRRVIEEGIAVAVASGAKIELNYSDFLVDGLEKIPAGKGSSMLTDRLKGNPIEINAKNGVICQLGERYDIATPANDLITHLLKYTNIE